MAEVQQTINLKRHILLLISKLKSKQYKELQKTTNTMEAEPYTGPLPNLLRQGFHKPYPEFKQTQSLLVVKLLKNNNNNTDLL